jgi:hypothetical protein
MVLLEHPQLPLIPSTKKLIRRPQYFFFLKSSRTHRHPVSPPKNAYFPITVLYEDKSGKSTPYELVLKPNATVTDVCFSWNLI